MGRGKKLRPAARKARPEKPGDLGVYEAHISAMQRQRLARMSPGLDPEVQLLRAFVDDCLRRMEESQDEEQRRGHRNAAMTALQRLFTAVRLRDARPKAKAADLLDDALQWVQAELGLEG